MDLIEAKLDQKIPDFEFVDLEGDSITSEDLEGKVVLRGIVGGLIEEVDEGIVEEHQLMWDELRVMMDQLLKE